MWPGAPTLELSTNVFKILGDLIHERTGLHYDPGKRELLAEKLSPIAVEAGFSSFLDFYYLLKYGPDSDQQWLEVMDALSVQETYFWREIGQIHALANHLLQPYVASAGTRVDIWCAACATGEEPLTIAMVLAEANWFDRADIRIHASDASTAAIARARSGIFRERSFRALPQYLRSKYFTAADQGWRVNADLLARITWSRTNLVDPAAIEEFVHVPFIFCRNVFIYFNDETIARTVRQFAKGMIRPGYLFVGAAESLLKLTDDFTLAEVGDAFVYVLQESHQAS